MNKILLLLKRIKWLILSAVLLVIFYHGFHFVENKILARRFFQKYNVLTVSGSESLFSLNAIELNGKVLKKTEEGWTNVLAVPNSLKYILMTSSYSKGKDIKCGEKIVPKSVDNIGRENTWCIVHNDKARVAVTGAQYYPYDANEIVYETCLQEKYYEGVGQGFNSCAKAGLFLNDEQIAETNEEYNIRPITEERYLSPASTFNYYPSKKIGSQIIYTTLKGTYAYDVNTKKTKQLITDKTKSDLEDIFLTNDGKTILVDEEIIDDAVEKNFPLTLGSIKYQDQNYSNIYSAGYIDGNFYILRLANIDKRGSSNLNDTATYELLKNWRKVENIELDQGLLFGYNADAIKQFPLCDTSTVVCVYEDGHYAYKKRTTVPEMFSDNFQVDEMVIDGEWRGEKVPNLIGFSKPIFENGKLKYIVFTNSFKDGLYLVDLEKKWNFKSIFSKHGSAITKLLGGYQNVLLNVVGK